MVETPIVFKKCVDLLLVVKIYIYKWKYDKYSFKTNSICERTKVAFNNKYLHIFIAAQDIIYFDKCYSWNIF